MVARSTDNMSKNFATPDCVFPFPPPLRVVSLAHPLLPPRHASNFGIPSAAAPSRTFAFSAAVPHPSVCTDHAGSFPPVYEKFLGFIGIFSFDRGCVVGYPVRRPFRQGSVGILVNDSWKRNVCPPFLRRMGIHWRIYLGSRVAT